MTGTALWSGMAAQSLRSDFILPTVRRKTRHQYNGPRLAEQGQYFGGLTEAETVAVGEEARDFSLGLLRAAPSGF